MIDHAAGIGIEVGYNAFYVIALLNVAWLYLAI